MKQPLSRRRFIGSATGAGLGAAAAGLGFTAPAKAAEKKAPQPAAPAAAKPAWPVWDDSEERALIEVLQSGRWGRTAGGATKVKAFEADFARRMNAKFCVATSSGTTALLTALGAAGLGPGDEVVLPPYTFVATFNAITASYALPVFADSDPASFQVDPATISRAITPATKVLLPVHIGGSPCNLDAITELARTRGLTLIEDACQALLAEWRGQPVGTRGIAGCFSFQASKNITAGEGGAVLTNDEEFANRCFNFHTPGASKPPLSGRASNYRLTEFQAALLLAQSARAEAQSKLRDANAAYLSAELAKIPGIAPARLEAGCTRSGWHLYMFRYDARQFAGLSRARFIQELTRLGVAASSGYTSLTATPHVRALAENPYYQKIYGRETMTRWLDRCQCPANDRLVEEAVWFSQHKLLEPRAEMTRVIETIAALQKRAGELAKS
jgi:dTDP-4-amino-4,6-dideoxygalactose transaminase